MKTKRMSSILLSFLLLFLLLACERSATNETSKFRAAERLTKDYVNAGSGVFTKAESIDRNGVVTVHAYVMEGDLKATISYYKVNTKTKTVSDTME